MLIIGSDHRGFELKKSIIENLNIDIKDIGCYSENRCDFPDIVATLAGKLEQFGVLICATGVGMSICANRYKNIRAALCLNEEMVTLSRFHLDVNVLIIPAKYIDYIEAIKMIKVFMDTQPSKDPVYGIRVKKIEDIS